MDIGAEISADVAIAGDLIKDIKAVLEKHESGLLAEGVDLVEELFADADFKAHISDAFAAFKA